MPDTTGAEIPEEGSSSYPRRCYTRCELEASRHVDPEQQRSRWDEIYRSLGSVVSLEYDSLVDSNPLKHAVQSVSRRQRLRKKKESEGSLCHPKVLEMLEGAGTEIAEEGFRRAPRRCYSRIELEAWMHIDPEQQRSRWGEIYRNLSSSVALEYDNLFDSAPPKPGAQRGSRMHIPRGEMDSVLEGGSFVSSHTLGSEVITNIGVEKDSLEPQPHSGVAETSSIYYEEPSYEEHEDDEDDDEEYRIQRPAFMVEGEPDFESGPPQDGLEYLRRVRWEAAQIPKVKVAKVVTAKKHSEQTPYMPEIPEIQKCPEMLLPRKSWEDAFLQDFSELRLSFSRFESARAGNSSPEPSNTDLAIHSPSNQSPDLPTLFRILLTTAVSRASMLIKRVEEFQSEDRLSRENCLWLFALCAVVDTPLYAELSAIMRSLLRKCSSLLASRSDPDDDEVAMLNILVAITGRYFGQSEERRYETNSFSDTGLTCLP